MTNPDHGTRMDGDARARRGESATHPPPHVHVPRRRRVWSVAPLLVVAAIALVVGTRGIGRTPADDYARYHARGFRVVYVVDGDTFDIDAPDGDTSRTRIRLWGVDTPEIAHGEVPAMHFGPQAREFAESVLAGKDVHLVLVPNATRGLYGRLLAYAFLEPGGRMFNEMLVEHGLAYADTRFEHPYRSRFTAIEQRSRSAGVGLWAGVTRDEMPPWRRRREEWLDARRASRP
jgi:micrococcal nuclease